jgi:hypothetical protein
VVVTLGQLGSAAATPPAPAPRPHRHIEYPSVY